MTSSIQQLSFPRDTIAIRSAIASLRQQLALTTDAYRQATAVHDSVRAIPLLRTRSVLMRQLLESQCQLLMALRTDSLKN